VSLGRASSEWSAMVQQFLCGNPGHKRLPGVSASDDHVMVVSMHPNSQDHELPLEYYAKKIEGREP
jgi:hypothetical protein